MSSLNENDSEVPHIVLPFLTFNERSFYDDSSVSVVTHSSKPTISNLLEECLLKTPKYNSYRLYENEKSISSKNIRQILKDELEALKDVRYDPNTSRELATKLSNNIKEGVKKLNYDRYRVISSVYIGNDFNQSMKIASKAIWNTSTDIHESYVFKQKNMYAVAVVFLIQQE